MGLSPQSRAFAKCLTKTGPAVRNVFCSLSYMRLPELLDDLCVKKDEEWVKTKRKYAKCDPLIIGDWMLEPLKEGEAREVLEIVEARGSHGSPAPIPCASAHRRAVERHTDEPRNPTPK